MSYFLRRIVYHSSVNFNNVVPRSDLKTWDLFFLVCCLCVFHSQHSSGTFYFLQHVFIDLVQPAGTICSKTSVSEFRKEPLLRFSWSYSHSFVPFIMWQSPKEHEPLPRFIATIVWVPGRVFLQEHLWHTSFQNWFEPLTEISHASKLEKHCLNFKLLQNGIFFKVFLGIQ